MKYLSIALFCGSSKGNSPRFVRDAEYFGRTCAVKGLTLYYGGGSIGLMAAAAGEALRHGGKVVGVAPDFFAEGEVLAAGLTQMLMVKTMSERKQLIERQADAFVVFPGAYGTMDELFEVVTDAQLGFHDKPVVVYNPDGFYDHLLAQIERFAQDGFLRPFHRGLLLSADTVDGLFRQMDGYVNPNDRQWLHRIRRG